MPKRNITTSQLSIPKHPKAIRNLIGLKFGRILPIGFMGTKNKCAYWLCLCDCGKILLARSGTLAHAANPSCGCSRRQPKSHGKTKSRAYRTWSAMIQRCTNPKCQEFKNYGNRGIGVCEQWRMFKNFYRDMGDPPPKHSLERVNNNRGYSLANCIWSTSYHQARNTRRNVWVEFNGRRQILRDWCQELGIQPHTTKARLNKGWSTEEAFGLVRRYHSHNALYTIKDQTKTLTEWSRTTGLAAPLICKRRQLGWTDAQCLGFEPRR